MADSRTTVGIDIVIHDGLGNISHSLFIAEIEEDTGNIDADANHRTDIKWIQLLMNTFLVEVLESNFVLLPP